MHRSIKRLPSPALVVACLALGIALAGNAGAIVERAAKSKPTVVASIDVGSVDRGGVGTTEAVCPKGYSVLTGGYGLRTGNIAIPINAFPTKNFNGYLTTFLVPPTAVGAPTQDATYQVKVVCAKSGVPVVLP